MPIIRYQIRNEYGLADPELYGAADKEDPEALLEGVAMAGLVGVLRQLGDLAEFAAEIFHDLHEEMMATSSRGHSLMLRVQQLEAEFPAIEKSFLSQTDHSNCTYNTGLDWHPNLQIDHNLITREDMPRFILDSYEESRGPPQLFVLDKFDIAGDGACLKRYSDPSFFKMNLDASGKMEPDIQREKRSRKNKKKMQRWRNGETPESYIPPHVNLKLESVASEKAPENPLVKRVKLKTRQLKENASIGRIYMEHILEKQSSDHIHLSDNSVSNSQVKMKIIDSTELAPEVREVVMDTSTCKPFSRQRNQTELHSKEELNFAQKEETVSDKKDREILQNEKKEETENLPPTFHKADQNELLDEADCKREGNDDAESRTNGSLDGYISDDVASELDSYLDALTTMDSEIETDNDTKAKPEPSFFSKEYNLGSNANEQRRLITESLDSHTFRKSSSTQSSLIKEMPAYPNGDSLSSLANSTPPHCTSRALVGMFMDAKASADETHDTNFKNNKVNSEVSGNESSTNLVPKEMTTDIVSTLTELGVESSTNHTTETTVALIHSSLRSSSGDVQSATANQNIIPRSATSTENIGKCHDGEYTPSNLDAEEAAEDLNVLLSNPVEGHKNGPEKLLEDDFHQRLEESRSTITEDDYVNSGHISKNTEILSGTPLHLGDEPDLNIWIQDDPSFETLVAVPCTEELSAEGIKSMPSDSYSTQMHKDINLETSTSTCVEDLPQSLSVSNEEEFHGSVCQDPEIYSAESTLSRKCSPVIPPNNNPSIFICDGLLRPADNSILSNETFECEKSSTSSEDATYFAEDKAASPQNMGSTAENEGRDSGISSPGPFFVMKMHQESSSSDQVEFTPKDVLPDIMKVPPNASVCETGDSPVSTGDHSNLLSGVIPFSSPMELLPSERDSPCLVTECVETDKLCSATLYTQESSSNYANLQEESFSTDSVLEQQQLEAAETSSLKDLTDMDVQQVLCTSASHEDHVVITGPRDSESAGHILDSSSQHDSGEPTYDCHTETFDLAEDLCPGDGNRATAISLEEVEGGELLNPMMENESKSTNSGIDHYVGNIETSISEDLSRGYDQKASTIAFLEQEVDVVVTVPGDSKSGEPVDDSFNHTDLKPPMNVLCLGDPKSALSPQNSRTEDRLPEPSDTSDFESVKEAEILEANEAITYTLESQVSHSEPLLSGEACQTLSGDAFLSHDVSAESISPSKEVFALQSSNESDVIFLQQKFGRLDLSDIQLERGLPLELDDNKIESQPLVPETAHDLVEAVSSRMIYQLDMASTNKSSLNQLEVEVDSPLQSSFGISACSAISHAPLSSLQTFPSLGSSSTMILRWSSELPLDEDPPLPPLPPLQWRVGKLQPTSFMPNGEMAQPQSGPNHLTALPSLDHSSGSLIMGGAGVQPPYPFSQEQELPNNSNQFGYQTLEAEGVNPFQLSGLSPAVAAQKCLDDVLPVDVQPKHIPATSSFVVSHLEDGQQKHELCQDALSGDVPQSLNPFMSPLPFSDVRSQQFPTALEGEPIEQRKSSDSLPTLVFLESEHGTTSMETATTPPSKPFLSSTSTEFENYHYSSGTFGVRMVQNQNFPDPLSTTEIAAPYILISQGENTQAFEGVTLSTEEYGKPNGRLCSLLNRPRHPLMEAVASHDKSTLRRVSELVHPLARTEDERNSLLEQIRNKSFNLKPATVTKPNMKGPTTNLKVAAILEKANTIRQAFVGSDEDDDGDTWSDS